MRPREDIQQQIQLVRIDRGRESFRRNGAQLRGCGLHDLCQVALQRLLRLLKHRQKVRPPCALENLARNHSASCWARLNQ